jgi:hypothetical protein
VNIKTEIDGNVEMNLLPKFMTPKGKWLLRLPEKPNENATLEQIIKVNKPDLWSVETPTLYTAVSENFIGRIQKTNMKTVWFQDHSF